MSSAAQPVLVVTGASGLIGSAVCRRFAADHRVVGLDHTAPDDESALDAFINTDLSSDESVDAAFRRLRDEYGEAIAAVVHLAAYYDFTGEPSEQYRQVTVEGTRRMLHELVDFDVGLFLFASTMLVHRATAPGERITETSPLGPDWPYPKSKVKTEEVILREHGEIPVVLARIGAVYDDDCRSLPLSQQIKRIYEKQFISHFYPGDPAHGQSYLHLEDLIGAIGLAVQHRGELPEESILLLGEPVPVSYGELQDRIGQLLFGHGWTTLRIPAFLAKIGIWLQWRLPFTEDPFIKPRMVDIADDHYDLDVSRARELLGWEPQHQLLETLPQMIAALRADPLRWYEINKLKPPADLHRDAAAEGAGEPQVLTDS